ncbi:MAG: uracil phosphoribosyltransferase [Sinomicrobium sp.]|nr:uracil phosphoribosyltransferase [Sinomicrobium sp.]
MRDFFEAIQYLFEEILFIPFQALRFLDSWWAANIVNWLLFVAGFAAMVYWILQLKKFDDNNEEDKSVTAHSFL